MSCLKPLLFKPIKLVGPTTIAQQPNNAGNRFVKLQPDLIAFHTVLKEESNQVESIESGNHEIEEEDNLPIVTDAEPTEIAEEILQTERLPDVFFDEEGKLQDIQVVRQILMKLAEDSNYENPVMRQYSTAIATEDSPAATLARIIINSIPLAKGVQDSWDNDISKSYFSEAADKHWDMRTTIFGALHMNTPKPLMSNLFNGKKENDVQAMARNIKEKPLFYIAQSALKYLGVEANASRFIRFVNNLELTKPFPTLSI